MSPVVPAFDAMIRTSFTSAHTQKDLDHVLHAFKTTGTDLGIIPQ